MATFTSSVYSNVQPRSRQAGLQALRIEYKSAGTVVGSAGDVILLARLPANWDMVNFVIRGSVPTDTNPQSWFAHVTPGNPASHTSTMAAPRAVAFSVSAVNSLPSHSMFFEQIRLSTGDSYQFTQLKMICNSGSATTSLSIIGMLLYTTGNTD